MYSLVLHGRRLVELQKWRHLRVSVQNATAFSNSFSSASVPDASLINGRKGENFTVSYLVDSLGLTTKLAESISRKVSFEDKGNPDSVLCLLRSYGFTDYQICSIITIYPRLLIVDAENSLGPKLHILQSRGASSSEFTEIVSTVPKILRKRGDNTISKYYDFVKYILREEEEADKSSKSENLSLSMPPSSRQGNKFRNISALRELGVPHRLLFSLLNSDHRFCGNENFEESLKKVVEMGFDPTSPKFVNALHVFYQMSDKTIEEKVNAYKRLGFTVEDVWAMFNKCPSFLNNSERKISQIYETLKKCGLLKHEILSVLKKFPQCCRFSEQKILNSIETFLGLGFSRDEFVMMVIRQPQCIGYSAETLKKKTEFLVKKMNWPLKALVPYPQVLGFSMEKRIVPRCNIIKALMSKGLLGDGGCELPLVSSVLKSTDQDFLNRFVRKHDDKELVPELMAIFTGKKRESF